MNQPDRWEKLVNWPTPEQQLRRALPLWQWMLHTNAYFVLEPAPNTRRPVFVESLKDETEKRPSSFDDIPMTKVRLCEPWSGETVISNAMILSAVSKRDTQTQSEIPESMLKLIKKQPFVPRDIDEYQSRTPRVLSAVPTRGPVTPPAELQEAEPFVADAEEAPPENDSQVQWTITLVHRTSKQQKEVFVAAVYESMIRIEWPMSGIYDLSKVDGSWRSSPRSLLKLWEIGPDSVTKIDEALLAAKARKKAALKKTQFGEK